MLDYTLDVHIIDVVAVIIFILARTWHVARRVTKVEQKLDEMTTGPEEATDSRQETKN